MRSLPSGTEPVVFDCDGLLVDTEACWTVAETAIFAAHGHPFGPEQKALVIGRTVEAAGEAVAQYLGCPGAGAELAADLLERVRTELSRGATALPGAAELVRACRTAVPIAVASNSPWGTAGHGTVVGRSHRLLHSLVRRRRSALPQART
ncbi:HAD family hydrolase [Streptomyces echinatus]|uniref:Beta-phosphoglucomutase-like phosphatase (HAD superfamily) n=1 Tax=Streptomyces echinatus TaxID=67293 RepID=A0A7W9UVL2_9ACTN|nr:HAD family phosphatase [Streptomyces echinatus]MBB5932910.1 beta-phosphoglucomutase-like phosphatase (HAD superfamily) [Streptomyces echinatus]